jgi:predicted DsbA family dithiol-disulfide isomerase
MQVEIWSDVVCPWCYIGKRRFETALAKFPARDDVEVIWRAFELDPGAPAVREGDPAERLARKYGLSVEQARASQARMTDTAADEGLHFRLASARSGNTFDAHRLLHFAHDRGVQEVLKERLLAAYLCEEQAIGDREVLVRAAADVGLDADEAAKVLDSDDYAATVRADEAVATSLGITGVPFFVIDRKYGVSGAQDPKVLLDVLTRAWNDGSRLELATTDEDAAAACEGDACPI